MPPNYDALFDAFFEYGEWERSLSGFEHFFHALKHGDDVGQSCFGEACTYLLPESIQMDATLRRQFKEALEAYNEGKCNVEPLAQPPPRR